MKHKRLILRIVFIAFLSIILLCVFAFIYIDRIIAFSVNHFTNCEFTYKKWGNSPFDKRNIYGMNIGLDKGIFTLHAEEAFFQPRFDRLFKDGQLVIRFNMKGVLLGSKKGTSSSDDIFSIPFKPEQKYSRMGLVVTLGRNLVKVTDFSARSKDVKMTGASTYLRDRNDISVYFKISFSPEISATFPEDLRKHALSLDDDGWYSTVIDYKGNALFLKALYSLAIPT